MTIIINHKPAVLKKGSSFEFVSENRFFTDADAYTLSITFPLRGCPQNLDIFGHINRKDHDLDRLLLDCEIHDRNFHTVGSVSIVSITEVAVKTQFLEGRSARNFHSDLDDIYINEITMPSLHFENRNTLEFYCRTYAEQLQRDYLGFVGLPWVNNTSGNIQNPLRTNDRNTALVYDSAGYGTFVGQPFLLEVLKQVLTAAGYSYNIEILEDSKFADIIICNAFPQVWEMDAMNLILPHWTVSEFLKQLELYLNGQFSLESGTRTMTFTFNSILMSQMKEVVLNNVVDVDKNQTRVVNALKVGEKEQKEEFYDKLYVAFWTGNAQRYFPLFPHPVVDKIEVRPDNTIITHTCLMRLTETKIHPISSLKHPIDQTQKFTFSFLSDTIPDVRSIFFIQLQLGALGKALPFCRSALFDFSYLTIFNAHRNAL